MDKYLKKIDAATILAALYASLVWVAYFYLNITPDKYMNIIFLITMFIGSYAFLQFIINKIRKSELTMPIVITRTVKCKVFFMTLFVTMGIMLIWILAYYPGSFSGDSIDQYGQALVKVKSFAPRQIQRRLFAALVTLSRKVFRPWHKWF